MAAELRWSFGFYYIILLQYALKLRNYCANLINYIFQVIKLLKSSIFVVPFGKARRFSV